MRRLRAPMGFEWFWHDVVYFGSSKGSLPGLPILSYTPMCFFILCHVHLRQQSLHSPFPTSPVSLWTSVPLGCCRPVRSSLRWNSTAPANQSSSKTSSNTKRLSRWVWHSVRHGIAIWARGFTFPLGSNCSTFAGQTSSQKSLATPRAMFSLKCPISNVQVLHFPAPRRLLVHPERVSKQT